MRPAASFIKAGGIVVITSMDIEDVLARPFVIHSYCGVRPLGFWDNSQSAVFSRSRISRCVLNDFDWTDAVLAILSHEYGRGTFCSPASYKGRYGKALK